MSMSPIIRVDPKSPSEKVGIALGERILSINGKKILDVLDYKFYSYDAHLTLELQDNEKNVRTVTIKKEKGQDLGLDFETYLMDKARSCANDCIFCFVDQMPKGMRDTLYFKDDDARLSFLTGNYITLTNLSKREIQRIIDLRISPINISVHATDPLVRNTMLKHPKAGDCLNIMKQFAQGRITMNCQIVACPSFNDGNILLQSLNDLAELYPWVHSISVVPVGLTRYRENLPKLQPYERETATEVISLVEDFARKQKTTLETSLVWCSDEFYLKAKLPLPDEEYYEEFTQLDNGVGMLCMFHCEFTLGLHLMEGDELRSTAFSIATGVAAAPTLQSLVKLAKEKSKKEGYPFTGTVYAIENQFFGPYVNVAGLVTGQDLISQLKGKSLGNRLLIPESMLRHGEDVFLDNVTIKQVEQTLNVTLIPIPQDGYDLVDAIYGVFTPKPRNITEEIPLTQEAYLYNP